jgi:hypothetical protein
MAASWLDGISTSTSIDARENVYERLLQLFGGIEWLDIIVNITLNVSQSATTHLRTSWEGPAPLQAQAPPSFIPDLSR